MMLKGGACLLIFENCASLVFTFPRQPPKISFIHVVSHTRNPVKLQIYHKL